MKMCSKCKEYKLFNEFHKNKNNTDGHQKTCKKCAIEEQMRHYHKVGTKKYNRRNQTYRERNKQFFDRYRKMFGKCVDCGITDYRVLQFDHLHNKQYNVSEMIHSGLSISLIKDEIRKCELRCANCHQIKTHYQ